MYNSQEPNLGAVHVQDYEHAENLKPEHNNYSASSSEEEANSDDVSTNDIDTEWTNAPSIMDLKEDIGLCRSNRDYHSTRIQQWRDMYHCRGMFSGFNGDEDHDTKRSTVQPKLIATQAEWRIATLAEPFLSTDDIFEVNASNQQSIKSAEQQTTILNYQWRTQLDRTNLINRLTRILCIDGTAVLHVGWDTQEVTEQVEEPLFEIHQPDIFKTQELQQELENALQIKQKFPDLYEAEIDEATKLMVYIYETTQQLVEPKQVGVQPHEKTRIVRNTPLVEVSGAENFYVDPSCEGDIRKAQFVARSFATCRGWLEASSVDYQNLDEVAWDSGDIRSDVDFKDNTDPTYESADTTRHKCVAVEYWGNWDIHGDGTLVPIVATWIGDTLIRLEENPYPDKKPPFVFISYTPQPYSIYGTPDAELTISNQRIIGAILRGSVDLMAKAAAGQRGISKDALDNLNFDRFQRGEDYMINPGVDMNRAVHVHDFPTINPSALQLMEQQEQDAQSLSGVRPFQGGLTDPSSSSIMSSGLGSVDASAIREADIMKRIADGLITVGKKIVSMNEMFLTAKDVVKITKDKFVPININNLSGEFDLRVSVQTQAQNSAKAKGLLFVLQTCGPNLDPAMRQMVLSEIATLTGLPALAQSIKDYQAQPDPMQQAEMQAKLELQKAQAQKYSASASKAIADSDHKNAQTQQVSSNVAYKAKQIDSVMKALLNSKDQSPDIKNAVTLMQAFSNELQQDQQQQGQSQQPQNQSLPNEMMQDQQQSQQMPPQGM